MKEIEFEGTQHSFPDDFTDAEIAKALKGGPAQTGWGGLYQKLRGGVMSGADAALDWTPGARKAAGLPSPGEQIGGFLPPNLTTGLAQTALGAAPALGKIPGVNRLPDWLTRIGAATAGGELGGQLEGRGTGEGAVIGGGPVAVGEALLGGGGKVIRGLPWMKGKIAGQDAARVGETIGEISPPLKGARTVEDLATMASGPGREALGAAKGAANLEIAGGIGARNALDVPSLSRTGLTLQQANDELSAIGAKAFSKNPLDRTFNGVDQRQLYGQVYKDITAALEKADPTGYSAAQFAKAQEAYSKGVTLLRLLERPSTYNRYSDSAQLNTSALQKLLGDPRSRAALQNKLGAEDMGKLAGSVRLDPANLLRRDEPTWGKGGMTDAARMLGEMRGGTGALVGAMPKTLLPNLGARYTGSPYTAPDNIKTLIDLLLQRETGEATR